MHRMENHRRTNGNIAPPTGAKPESFRTGSQYPFHSITTHGRSRIYCKHQQWRRDFARNLQYLTLAPPVQLLITHLRRHTSCPQSRHLNATITDDEYTGKLKSWSESTSTSPSGLHLGHYKALVARHEYSDCQHDDPRRIQWDQMQSDIRNVHLTLLNYALQRGYSYLWWQQVSNAMIFKEANNIKIH